LQKLFKWTPNVCTHVIRNTLPLSVLMP
jgi:hypothetical protein